MISNEVKYAVRYYFYGVPHDKHYGYRSFQKLSEAINFAEMLDPYNVEQFDIAEINVIHKQCISTNYCPQKSKCKKCDYQREKFDYER